MLDLAAEIIQGYEGNLSWQKHVFDVLVKVYLRARCPGPGCIKNLKLRKTLSLKRAVKGKVFPYLRIFLKLFPLTHIKGNLKEGLSLSTKVFLMVKEAPYPNLNDCYEVCQKLTNEMAFYVSVQRDRNSTAHVLPS